MGRLIRFILDMDARAWRTIVVTFLLFGGAGLIFVVAIPALGFNGQATVGHWLGVAAKSPFALLIAVGAFAVLAFAGVPQVVLIAAAVVAFGAQLGFAYSWIGTMVSAAVGFWLGRITGGRMLRQVGGEKLKTFMAMIGRNGFLASLIVRLVPSAPFVVVNMAAGMTPMRFSSFALGAAIGIVPKILLTVMAGRSVAHARSGGLVANAALFVLALLIWMGAGLWARRWIRRHETSAEGPEVAASRLP